MRLLVWIGCASIMAACGGGQQGPGNGGGSPAPFHIIVTPTGINVPRGNSASVTVTVGRAAGFTDSLDLDVKDLPPAVWIVDTVWSGKDKATLTFVAQSDAPDGIFPVKVRAFTNYPPQSAEAALTVTPEVMKHAPANDDECKAHWAPIIAGTHVANGWKVVSRVKDGVSAALPDDRYRTWMFAFAFPGVYGLRSDFETRERVEHVASFNPKSDTTRHSTIQFQIDRCDVAASPVVPNDGTDFQRQGRRWKLVSHQPAGGSLPEQVVIHGLGTEVTFTKPVYDLTLERAQLPPP